MKRKENIWRKSVIQMHIIMGLLIQVNLHAKLIQNGCSTSEYFVIIPVVWQLCCVNYFVNILVTWGPSQYKDAVLPV